MLNEKIEELTTKILKEEKMFKIPVDPVLLANKLGIKVNNAIFDDNTLSGMIAKKKNSSLILVNNNDTAFRKRYTIAHEIGHLFLHLKKDGEYIDYEINLFRDDNDPALKDHAEYYVEVEANKFAAALLMNKLLVKEMWDKYKSIEKLSKLFNVSSTAMAIRINDLGLS
jgi:Zn-dependent peptidase ImmA (M78 family)